MLPLPSPSALNAGGSTGISAGIFGCLACRQRFSSALALSYNIISSMLSDIACWERLSRWRIAVAQISPASYRLLRCLLYKRARLSLCLSVEQFLYHTSGVYRACASACWPAISCACLLCLAPQVRHPQVVGWNDRDDRTLNMYIAEAVTQNYRLCQNACLSDRPHLSACLSWVFSALIFSAVPSAL